jgi:hypothetical protein
MELVLCLQFVINPIEQFSELANKLPHSQQKHISVFLIVQFYVKQFIKT